MSVGLALLPAPLAPVLDGHWLVGFYHIGDLQFRVDLGKHTKKDQSLPGAEAGTHKRRISHHCYSKVFKSAPTGELRGKEKDQKLIIPFRTLSNVTTILLHSFSLKILSFQRLKKLSFQRR